MAHLYTAKAHVKGGRNGHGRTDDGILDLDLKRPGAMGGDGGATNPEQLFAIAYGACFEGALAAVARRTRVDVGQTSVDSTVELHSREDGTFGIEVELAVTLPGVTDAETAKDLVAQAHLVCPYSNALRGNVDVVLSANGEHVAGAR
ncbi:organic hydroperoxide resistance protein [Microbacterium sediminicola]|uniref:Organic hydroperoxide resistance protein n=1 Tax=Microbacterium sediminicola TaxID=415210 RepID=A0ABP4TY37_9MICO